MSMISAFLSRLNMGPFSRAVSGNVSIIFAFSLVPVIGLTGLGVDYGIAQSAKAKLDNAADAAAVAAVATAKAYIANNASDTNATANAIAAGRDRATRAFAVNAGHVPFTQVPTPTITLIRTNQTFSSTVAYATSATSQFGRLFGQTAYALSGTAAAAADVPSYLDFYLLVDVSGSMGLPSTSSGQTYLASINHDNQSSVPEGCQFACHFPGYTGYSLAIKNNIQLRSGAVNYAVCQLLKLAGSPAVPNQYRVGFYPFINQMVTFAALTSNITSLQTTADCSSSSPMAFTQILDTGTTQFATGNDPSTGTGSGGTHFEKIMPSMQTTISSYGDGTLATKSKPFVFLITDGMDNGQHYAVSKNSIYYYPGNPSTYSGYGNANFDGSSPQAITSSLCSSLKTAGATISILYIPYTPLVYTNDPWGEDLKTNNAIPNLPANLQQCATSGFFYTANTPADISSSLQAMFNQAVQVAHLKQ